MERITWSDVNKHFKVGDEVWACAFEPTKDKESKHNFCKPVKGVLVTDLIKERDEQNRKNNKRAEIRYFIPYKQNGVDLARSRAVTIYSRYFCKTEEECKVLYNELVQECINWHLQEVEDLKQYLLEEV